MINDLIGLDYKAGAKYFDGCRCIDCFGLFCEVRRRLGLRDYEQDFQWVYDAERLPVRAIVKAMREIARRTESPQDGDLAVIGGSFNRLAVGTVINGGILTIPHEARSFWSPSLFNVPCYSSL